MTKNPQRRTHTDTLREYDKPRLLVARNGISTFVQVVYRTAVAPDLLQAEGAKLSLSIHDFLPEPLDNVDERNLSSSTTRPNKKFKLLRIALISKAKKA